MTDPRATSIPSPIGAMCGQHPEQAAVITCVRCGDFACNDCAARASQGMCPACVQRSDHGVVLNRDTWTVSNVFGHAWRTLTARPWSTMGVTWAMLLPLVVLFLLPSLLAIPAITSGTFTAQAMYTFQGRIVLMGASVLILLVGSPLMLGLFAYATARAGGRHVGLEVLPAQLSRIGQYAMLILITTPVLWALSLLQRTPELLSGQTADELSRAALAPSIMIPNMLIFVLTSPIMLVQYMGAVELVIDHDATAIQALTRTAAHLRHRLIGASLTALLIGLVGFVSFTCCFVPAIFFCPFALLAFATLYIAMRTPAT